MEKLLFLLFFEKLLFLYVVIWCLANFDTQLMNIGYFEPKKNNMILKTLPR